MRQFFPRYVYNPITFFGAGLAGLSFGLIVFLTILELLSPESKPYMGIITFIILPIFLLMGIFLLIFGAFILFELYKKKAKLKDAVSLIFLPYKKNNLCLFKTS